MGWCVTQGTRLLYLWSEGHWCERWPQQNSHTSVGPLSKALNCRWMAWPSLLLVCVCVFYILHEDAVAVKYKGFPGHSSIITISVVCFKSEVNILGKKLLMQKRDVKVRGVQAQCNYLVCLRIMSTPTWRMATKQHPSPSAIVWSPYSVPDALPTYQW